MVSDQRILEQYWKNNVVPMPMTRVHKACFNILMDKITAIRQIWDGRRNAQENFINPWQPFIINWNSIKLEEIAKEREF